MAWIKKNWLLIAAAILAYMYWDKISAMLGLSKNTPKTTVIGHDSAGNPVTPTDWDKNADGVPDAIQPIQK